MSQKLVVNDDGKKQIGDVGDVMLRSVCGLKPRCKVKMDEIRRKR